MAEKDENQEAGEQLDLIDYHPENAKEIVETARLYKKFQKQRIATGKKEVEYKDKIRGYAKEAKLQPLENGNTEFTVNGWKFVIEPRDELVRVTECEDAD